VLVANVHERTLPVALPQAAPLLDQLASDNDVLWPLKWPAMRFDRPLSVAAAGGHGPVRYFVETYIPGRSISFRFTGPRGFNGGHMFELIPVGENETRFRHALNMRAEGPAKISWSLVFRPLHDALLEDAFDAAEHYFGLNPKPSQ